MYQPKKSSSSSPRNLFLQLSGNSFWICSHRLESTNVPFREFLLAQLDILIRQRGQRKFASSTFFLKHGPHSSCSHGIITGSMSICKHIGHVKSDKETEMSVPSLKFNVLGLATFPAAILRINNNLYFWRQIITFGPVPQWVHLKAVFWLGIMFLMQISRLRFKQSRICSLITHIYVLRRFVNFLVIFRFIWRQIVFLKGLVKFMEIGNFEDLVLF